MSEVTQFFKELGPAKLAGIGIALLTFLIVLSVYIYKIGSPNMAVLYSGLDLEDSSKIVHELDTKKVPYTLAANGSVIRVPEDQVLRLRMNMAEAGLPNKGSVVGYEIFDKDEALGTTNFLQNVKMVRALEGELSRTIGAFDQIDKVRVHLVIPQRELFSKEKQEPKSSVMLKLRASSSLSKTEVTAIGHLVAAAVPGLDIQNVTIVDTKGKSLKLGGQEENEYGGSYNEDYKVTYEQRVKKTIEDLLEQSLGAGKVKAQVSVEMNFDRVVTNSEIYDPDGAVVRSVQAVEEKERNPLGGEDNVDVSVANNLPGTTSAGDGIPANVATVERSDETTNYEISKTTRNQISETGTIKKLSIAVLVDGTYTKDQSGQFVYVPRSEEELKKYANLVKAAVGFKEDRHDTIEVVNMRFSPEFEPEKEMDLADWFKEELPSLFQTLVLAVVVVLVLVTVVRPIAIKAFDVKRSDDVEESIKDATAMRAHMESVLGEGAEGGAELDIRRVERGMSVGNASAKKVSEIVQSYPEETLMVLRKWLNES